MISLFNQEAVENQLYFKTKLNEMLAENYCVIYEGGMTVYKGEDNYTLSLHLLNQDNPLFISGNFLDDDSFLDYVIKEMKQRKLFEHTSYYKLNKVYD